MKQPCSRNALCAAMALFCAASTRGDPVIQGDQTTPLLSPEERAAAATLASLAAPPASPPSPTPFTWGDFTLFPHFDYSIVYSSGIPDMPGQTTNTYIEVFSPGFLLDIGSHWSVNYTPSWNDYTSRRFYNYWGQDLDIAGSESRGSWDLRLTQDYVSSSSTLIETGQQTKSQIISTLLSGTHHYNSSLYLELNGAQDFRLLTTFPDSLEWSTTDWLGYKFGTLLDVAAGCGEGFVILYGSPDMIYTRPKVRIKWEPTNKITLSAEGGYERREFLSGGLGALNNPIMNGTLEYRPFDTTTLTIGTEREVEPSYFRGQLTKTVKYNGIFEQRLLGRYYASVTAAYNDTDYVGAALGVATGRQDSSFSYGGRLTTTFLGRGTFAVFVQHLKNQSNFAGYAFSTRQIGCEVGYHF